MPEKHNAGVVVAVVEHNAVVVVAGAVEPQVEKVVDDGQSPAELEPDVTHTAVMAVVVHNAVVVVAATVVVGNNVEGLITAMKINQLFSNKKMFVHL